MNKKNITLMVIAIATLITFGGLATYAYFTGTINLGNTSNITTSTERNNLVFDTSGGVMELNITAANMQKSKAGTVAAENNTTLTVNLTANTDYSMVCTYDIIYEWTSSDRYTSHSDGLAYGTKEFTIVSNSYSDNDCYFEEDSFLVEKDISEILETKSSETVVKGAQIDATGSETVTQNWKFTARFYNILANQSLLSNKTYSGKFKVANVSCVAGESKERFDRNEYIFSSSTVYDGIINSELKIAPSIRALDSDIFIKREGFFNQNRNICAYISEYDQQICFSLNDLSLIPELASWSGGTFDSELQTAIANFIVQRANSNGVNISINNCVLTDYYVGCLFNSTTACGASTDGTIACLYDENLAETLNLEGANSCSLYSDNSYSCIDKHPEIKYYLNSRTYYKSHYIPVINNGVEVFSNVYYKDSKYGDYYSVCAFFPSISEEFCYYIADDFVSIYNFIDNPDTKHDLTEEEQNKAINSIISDLKNQGITIDKSSCYSSTKEAYCMIDGVKMGVFVNDENDNYDWIGARFIDTNANVSTFEFAYA